MKVAIYEYNGKVFVVVPVNSVDPKHIPHGVAYWLIDKTIYEEYSREFRDFWELDLEALGEPTSYGTGGEQ